MKAVIIIAIAAAIGFIVYDWAILEPKRDAARREADALWMRYVYRQESHE